MRFLTTLLIILIFCLALVFMYQNRDEMARVRIGSQTTDQTPVFFIILGAFLVGVVFTSVIGIIEGMKLRMANARLKRKLKKVQSELDDLRNLPLTGPVDADPESHLQVSDEDSAL
ncbi:MAG TPA: LapA family protein [Candidatus Polarisedimenticolia bacterium]|nr:LapA family protein [Candidatus Polarisedimenticolia bacterium]